MKHITALSIFLAAAFGPGCISLGPTPGLTFTSAVPASRPGAEVSAAIVPGYLLSDAVTVPDDPQPRYGNPMLQLSFLLDPSTLLGNLGLSAGFRVISASDGYVEPELRWRRSFGDDDLVSVGATASGTAVSYRHDTDSRLTYRAGRGSLEAGGELRLTPPWWVELRALGGGSVTALSASGTWCANATSGHPIDCPTDNTPVLNVSGSAMGMFFSGYGGLAIDVARPLNGFFHFGRVAGVIAAGTAPTMLPATPQPGITQSAAAPVTQGPDARWAFWGLAVTLGFGAPRPEKAPPPAPAEVTRAPRAPAPPPVESNPANLRGQVRATSGEPVPGATVQLVEANRAERTDARGVFELRVAPGRYTLRFEAPGLVAQTKVVTVTPGEQALFFVDLAPASP